MENEAMNKLLDGARIMWVEDDVFLNDIIARRMKNYNGSLLHANNGDEAFTILQAEKPDIIILDILLPGMNGFEILEKIKNDPTTKDIPVMILSNFGQDQEVEKGMALGAEKYLVKATLTPDEILSEVQNILETKQKLSN